MTASKVRWCSNGTMLAVAGMQETPDTKAITHVVQFYSSTGQYLRVLKVPGSGIKGLSWEGSGLRLAMAVDSYVFFAHLRPDYKWTTLNNTIVYAFTKSERPGEHGVVFWNHKSSDKNVK